VKIGAVFPHQEIGEDPLAIRDWAQAAEDLGYSHILAYDHVIGAVHEGRDPKLGGPYTENDAFHEPLVLFGYLAACTRRVGLVTGILILPQRQTVLVAKQTTQIDILSGERLRLGVGTGWNYVEYDSLNESFEGRGEREEEQVELIRRLWREPVVDYSGKHHRIDRAGLKPLPRRQIPIWLGGFSPVAFRRAARIADGFIFGSSQEQNLEGLAVVCAELEKAGRDPSDFGIEALLNYQSGPEMWRSEAEAWREEGADFVSLRAHSSRRRRDGLDSPQAQIAALSRYWEAIGDLAEGCPPS